MIANPPIDSLIKMFNHYKKQADGCWELYPDLVDAYLCYDHYMEQVNTYEQEILKQL